MTESTNGMIDWFIFRSILFSFLTQLIIITWNLSEFTITSVILNQSMADLFSCSNILMSSSALFLAAYIALSSSKFARSTSLINKNKLFIYKDI